MNLLHELLQALRVHRSPLLVTDTNLLQIEWCRMTHIGTELTPLRGDRSIGKLDEVECIVDIALEILDCYMRIRILIPLPPKTLFLRKVLMSWRRLSS